MFEGFLFAWILDIKKAHSAQEQMEVLQMGIKYVNMLGRKKCACEKSVH